MAELVVEALEHVDVEHRDRERRADTVRPLALGFEALREGPSIGEAGQRIREAQLGERGVALLERALVVLQSLLIAFLLGRALPELRDHTAQLAVS